MRRALTFLALALPIMTGVAPAAALDRLPLQVAGQSPVVRIADLDRPLNAHPYRRDHTESYWYWRNRAAYARWMHNEHVRAGYPVRHRQFRTYARTIPCCDRYGHW